jgi:hypothetical protein
MTKIVLTLLAVVVIVLGFSTYGLTRTVDDLRIQARDLDRACIPTNTGGGVTQCRQPNMADENIRLCLRANVYPRTLLGQCLEDVEHAGSIGTAVTAIRDSGGHVKVRVR